MKKGISLKTQIMARLTCLKWLFKRGVAKNTIGAEIAPMLVENPLMKWPRNYSCVCGSGKKFKKCCLNGLNRRVTIEDADMINKRLDRFRV